MANFCGGGAGSLPTFSSLILPRLSDSATFRTTEHFQCYFCQNYTILPHFHVMKRETLITRFRGRCFICG